VTLRDTTERPITVTQGTNTVVGSDPERIRAVVWDILSTGGKAGKVPELWDGHAAERIAQVIATWVQQRAGLGKSHDCLRGRGERFAGGIVEALKQS
jgi:UDP-N-acetylglucosamine 2-epimerase (non-hydrolysing)